MCVAALDSPTDALALVQIMNEWLALRAELA